jgi:hypothetical protein
MAYIPSGGIIDGQIIYDYQVKQIIDGLSGTTGYDINMGTGTVFVNASQTNVGINTITPNPLYKLVVNGGQLNNNALIISGSSAQLFVNDLIASNTATNFVTYDPITGQFFTTSSGILGNYLNISSTGSMLTPYLLVSQTSSMLVPYLLTSQTGSFATTGSNIFKGNQIISGTLAVTGAVSFTNIAVGSAGGNLLTYNPITGLVSYTSSTSLNPDFSAFLLVSATSSMLSPYLLIAQTGSFATTGSNIFKGNQTITGGLLVSGGLTTLLNTSATGSFNGPLTGTASWASSASTAINSQTASYVNLTNGNSNISIDYVNYPGKIGISGQTSISNKSNPAGTATTLNFGDFITASIVNNIATINVSSSILGGVILYDNGNPMGSYYALNFGDNIIVGDSGSGVANLTGAIRVAKDGITNATLDIRALNFTGSGVSSVSVASGTASIFIPATSGVIVQNNEADKGSNTTINFVGATVATSSGTATITITGGAGSPSVQSTSNNALVPSASSFIFSGSGVIPTQVNTNTASIYIPGVTGSNNNIQYNNNGNPGGASTFNFISSSNQVQLTGSLIISNSGGSYILSSSGAVFSSSLYTTSSVYFAGLATTSSISNILTYNPTTGQLYYTSSDEYQRVNIKYGSNITSSKMIEFTGSGVSVTYSTSPVTSSINIPSYINPGPTGYISFYSSSGVAPTSQSLYPVSSSNQGGLFWDITNKRLGINKITPEYTLEVSGSFGATTKSFIIPHKSQEGKYLQYGVTEGPEHSVFVRGKSTSHIVELPEEWTWLVNSDTITVNLTSVGEYQNLHILDIADNKIIVGSNTTHPNFHYQVFAERKDVSKLKIIL